MANSTMTTDTMRQSPSPAVRALLRPARRLAATLALAGTLTLSSGCLYRMKVEQGNFLDPSQVVQLQEGMTKSQVKFLLGTPMLPNAFDSDRWNYYYYAKTRTMKEPFTARVTVYFKDDKVDHFDRPANTEALAAAMDAANTAALAEASARDVVRTPSTMPTIPEPRRQPGPGPGR